MFVTQKKMNGMKSRIDNLEGQVEALTNEKLEERNKKFKEILSLDDKIVQLGVDRRKLENSVKDIKADAKREKENIQHSTKIVMEKHDVELEKKKNELIQEKNVEVAKLKDEFRDKLEDWLKKQSAEMKGMYSEVLTHLTKVSGTIHQPAGVSNYVNDK